MAVSGGKNRAWVGIAAAWALLWCCAALSPGQTLARPASGAVLARQTPFEANTAPRLFAPPPPVATSPPGIAALSHVIADRLPVYSLTNPFLGDAGRASQMRSQTLEAIARMSIQMLQWRDDYLPRIIAARDLLQFSWPPSAAETSSFLGKSLYDVQIEDPRSIDTILADNGVDAPMLTDWVNELWVFAMVVLCIAVIAIGYRLVLRSRRGLPQDWEY